MSSSTYATAISITNTMIGSSIIVLPILFLQNGVILSSLILVVLCLVQYKTCEVLVRYLRDDEQDVCESIERIMGKKWKIFNLGSNVLLLYIVCIVYFQLVAQVFYPIMGHIFKALDQSYRQPSRSQFVLSEFSYQWAGIYVMIFMLGMFALDQIKPLLKVLNYFLYLFVRALTSLVNGDIPWHKIILFSNDFSNVAGTFALSFLIHSCISPIIKNHRNQASNKKALFVGYILTGLVYLYIGVVGTLACGAGIADASNFENLFDCFQNGIIDLLIELLIMLQLISVLTILVFSTRQQFFMIVDPALNTPYNNHLFTALHVLLILGVQLSGVNVSAIISFDGAIVGFFIVYLIPIALHAVSNRTSRKESLIEEQQQQRREKEEQGLSLPKRIFYVCLLGIGVGLGVFKVIKYF